MGQLGGPPAERTTLTIEGPVGVKEERLSGAGLTPISRPSRSFMSSHERGPTADASELALTAMEDIHR